MMEVHHTLEYSSSVLMEVRMICKLIHMYTVIKCKVNISKTWYCVFNAEWCHHWTLSCNKNMDAVMDVIEYLIKRAMQYLGYH